MMLATTVKAQSDTVHVYFGFGKSEVALAEQKVLDPLPARLEKGMYVLLFGYSDNPGSAAANQVLSTRRAQYISKLLQARGVPKDRIRQCDGLGVAAGAGIDSSRDFRRVDVVVGYDYRTVEDLNTFSAGETLELRSIQFEGGTHKFMEIALPELETLTTVMKEHPALKVKLEGHVCCNIRTKEDGFDEQTGKKDLSFQRANAVLSYLQEHGIAKERLSVIGMACSKPKVNPEVTDEDREQNRRVEVRIMSK